MYIYKCTYIQHNKTKPGCTDIHAYLCAVEPILFGSENRPPSPMPMPFIHFISCL